MTFFLRYPLPLVWALLSFGVSALQAGPTPDLPPIELSLPSAAPSGIPVNDRIWLTFYPAVHPAGTSAPAVVMLQQYAGRNRPRRVLMIQTARDLLVPPRNAIELWEALGRPPIRWLDTNHFGIVLAQRSLMRASAAYLHGVWGGPSEGTRSLPAIYAPTVKLGFLFGLGPVLAPALEWHAYSFAARRDHMSLLHADLGWSTHGAFAGLAVTLNAFLDLGLARRFHHGRVGPYVSLHIVF